MKAIQEFVKYVKNHKEVWFAKRIEIADHWKNIIHIYPVNYLHMKCRKKNLLRFLVMYLSIIHG